MTGARSPTWVSHVGGSGQVFEATSPGFHRPVSADMGWQRSSWHQNHRAAKAPAGLAAAELGRPHGTVTAQLAAVPGRALHATGPVSFFSNRHPAPAAPAPERTYPAGVRRSLRFSLLVDQVEELEVCVRRGLGLGAGGAPQGSVAADHPVAALSADLPNGRAEIAADPLLAAPRRAQRLAQEVLDRLLLRKATGSGRPVPRCPPPPHLPDPYLRAHSGHQLEDILLGRSLCTFPSLRGSRFDHAAAETLTREDKGLGGLRSALPLNAQHRHPPGLHSGAARSTVGTRGMPSSGALGPAPGPAL